MRCADQRSWAGRVPARLSSHCSCGFGRGLQAASDCAASKKMPRPGTAKACCTGERLTAAIENSRPRRDRRRWEPLGRCAPTVIAPRPHQSAQPGAAMSPSPGPAADRPVCSASPSGNASAGIRLCPAGDEDGLGIGREQADPSGKISKAPYSNAPGFIPYVIAGPGSASYSRRKAFKSGVAREVSI